METIRNLYHHINVINVIPYILEVIKGAKNGPDMPAIPYKWNNTSIDLIIKDNDDNDVKDIVLKNPALRAKKLENTPKTTHVYETATGKKISDDDELPVSDKVGIDIGKQIMQARLDKKLKMVQLQLAKARLDHQVSKDANKDPAEVAIEGQGVVLDRNELLKQILNKKD